jgi:hypothetical protein
MSASEKRSFSEHPLLQRPDLWLANQLSPVRTASIPSGFAKLDRELPGGGWPTGCLTEILTSQGAGIGELSCLMPALARLSTAGRWQTWIAPPHLPYAPALVAAGIDAAKLIIVTPQPNGARDTLWSIEQTLRANACGAVLAWPQPTGGPALKYAELRRLQIAAEASEVITVLFRPESAANEASPAALRIKLAPAPHGQLALHLLKRRGLAAEAPVLIDLSRPHALGSRHLPRFAPRGVPAREAVN